MKQLSQAHTIGLILHQDGKILISRQTSKCGSTQSFRSLPQMQVSEYAPYPKLLQTLAQDALKIQINPKACTPPILMHAIDKKEQHITLGRFVSTDLRSSTPRNNQPDKCDRIARFPISELPTLLGHYDIQVLEAWQDGRSYVEYTVDHIDVLSTSVQQRGTL